MTTVLTVEDAPRLNLGRRRSDKWLAEMLERHIMCQDKETRPLLTQHTEGDLAVIPAYKRRPRRTKAQLVDALKRARVLVKNEHKDWPMKKVNIRARSMVRLYQVV